MSAEDTSLRDRRVASTRAVRSRRLQWAGAIGLVLVVLMATTTADTAQRRERAVGVDLEETENGLLVLGVSPGGPAEDAGLIAGDLLVKVEGREVLDFAAYDRAATTFDPRARFDFQVLRDSRLQVLEVTPGRPFPWLTTIIEWLACLAYLALGAVALVQLPGDLRARLLMLLSLAIALELALPVDLLSLPGYENFSFPVVALLVGFQIGLELHLASSIPSRQRFGRHRRWLVPAFYGVGCGLGSMLATTLIFDSFGIELPWTLELAETLVWDVGNTLWAVAVTILLTTAVARCRDALSRQQTLLVLLAGLPWSIHMLALVWTGRLGGVSPEWLGVVEPVVLVVYPLGVLFAIFRYQLFDLEVVVKRGLVYTVLTGVLVLIFYASIGAGGALLSRFLPGDDTSIWLVAFATLVLGLLFAPMRRATQRVIDRQFFPERTALREKLIHLASDLPARGSLPAMGQNLVEEICDMFGLEAAAVLLGAESGILSPLASTGAPGRTDESLLLSNCDPAVRVLQRTGRPLTVDHLTSKSPTIGDRLRPFGAEVLVPLLRRDQLIGLLVLGRKLGGRPFPAEELELLNHLSQHVATAFEYSQLYESATRDSLTGLLRRGAVLDALNRELDRSFRFGRPLALAMVDIDRFKDVNDRHGHLKGDMTLKRVSETISRGLRVTDQIGRYGGEEFLIVLPETDASGVQVVVEKLRDLVEKVTTTADNGEEIRVTISIGVVTVDQRPGTGEAPEVNDLIAAADAALYRAKTGGRNRVEMRTATG